MSRKSPFPPKTDFFSKYGAGLLADHINAFWKGRVKAERYELDAGLGWGVRSNLVGGLPLRKVAGKTLAARRAEFLHGA
jgi:hypothetical protein